MSAEFVVMIRTKVINKIFSNIIQSAQHCNVSSQKERYMGAGGEVKKSGTVERK